MSFRPGLPDRRTYTAVVFYSHRQPKLQKGDADQRLVLETGLEPVWCLHRQILSLLPLPI